MRSVKHKSQVNTKIIDIVNSLIGKDQAKPISAKNIPE